MSQILEESEEVTDEECKRCVKEAKLNSENTNDCYTCRGSRRIKRS